MNIVQQVEEAHDLLELLAADDALTELGYVLGHDHGASTSRLVSAVAAMRLAMDDPSCVDEIEPGQRPTGSSILAGRSLHKDPTADAALAKNTARSQHRDLVRKIADLHRAAKAGKVKAATSKAYGIATMVTRWMPREATAKERMEGQRDLDPGCVSCARTFVRPGVRRYEPVYRGDLCSWCDRGPVGKRVTGEAPPLALVEAHHAADRKTIARAVASLPA